MQLILISLISLIAGAVAGYFYQKSKSQNIITEKELLAQQVEILKSQQNEFRGETFRNSMLEASREVSKELLDHHKRENNEAKKTAEEITKKETENLHKEFKSVVEKLAAVQGINQAQDKKLSAIWQSLTSPVKASNFAEIGLENTLKNFGLQPGIDFLTQSSIDGRLRPDAIINLPSGNLILIDAKTSKYFLEISAAETDVEQLKIKLAQSMNTHLQSLKSRDYAAAARAKQEGIVIVNVMYLPNDAAYSRVIECDSEFDAKCRDAEVLLITPTSLNMLLEIARHQISRHKQEQNFTEIKLQMGKVVSSVDMLLRGLHKVGKSIKAAADSYSELSKPGNRLLGRIKRVEELGLEPENKLNLPEALPNFNVMENQPVIVENESQERPETVKILDKKFG